HTPTTKLHTLSLHDALPIYYQTDYPKRFADAQSPYFVHNGKQLLLSTYNGSEGKLSILPLINPGLANIDQAKVKTFEGFGKILLDRKSTRLNSSHVKISYAV